MKYLSVSLSVSSSVSLFLIMNILYNSLTQSTVEFLHWVTQVMLNYFALNVVLTHSFNFFIITKRICDLHHFCKWKFLYSILQVAVSTFYTNYADANVCCNYASFEVLLQLCRWYFLLQLCWWIFLLQWCRWLFCCNLQLEVSAAFM